MPTSSWFPELAVPGLEVLVRKTLRSYLSSFPIRGQLAGPDSAALTI